jgi:hypothetical protein
MLDGKLHLSESKISQLQRSGESLDVGTVLVRASA